MELRELAGLIGIDLPVTLERFMGNEALYLRFLKKYPDGQNFSHLEQEIEQGNPNYETIEREAHTLKGVAGNLGLANIQEYSDEMVQAVRNHQYDLLWELFQKLKKFQQEAVEGISRL